MTDNIADTLLGDTDKKRVSIWKEDHGCSVRKSKFIYNFTPTNTALLMVVRCECGRSLEIDKCDLSDFEGVNIGQAS